MLSLFAYSMKVSIDKHEVRVAQILEGKSKNGIIDSIEYKEGELRKKELQEENKRLKRELAERQKIKRSLEKLRELNRPPKAML